MGTNIGFDAFQVVFRSLMSLLLLLFILARIMGKKQISQLTFFDYVVGITIGSIAANFVTNDSISYLKGILELVVYAISPIIVSYITLKSIRLRKILGGEPTILIQNGKLIENNLRKVKFHINDILEELRLKDVFSLEDVEYAILETSGKVSVQLKANKQTATCEDLKLPKEYKGLSAELIIDGEVIKEHLKLIKRDQEWLINELKKQKVNSPRDVLLATFDGTNKLSIDLKNQDPKPFKTLL